MEILAELVITVVVVGTGRVLVTVLTMGRWRVASMFSTEEQVHGPAGALSFVRDGQRVVTTTGQGFLGFGFYVLVAITLVFWS